MTDRNGVGEGEKERANVECEIYVPVATAAAAAKNACMHLFTDCINNSTSLDIDY